MTKAEIYDFIHKHNLCVVSTIHDNDTPQAAVVGFSDNEKFELFIGTSIKTKKYGNILRNPHVAVVIGYEEEISVQLKGIATVLEGDELKPYLENHFKKLPNTKKRLENPNQTWILIKPSWLRYTDANPSPWVIEEINF